MTDFNVEWFSMASSLYEMRLQEIMVVVFITLGLDVYFDEYNYHDSLQARLTEVIGH